VRIRWTRRADCDLDALADHLGGRSQPHSTVLRIIEVVEHLADHPHLGRPGRIPDTRELVISGTPYIVPYRVRDDALEVLRVLHGAMRWPDTM
jgi:toxin ParE1/3/4